MDQKPWQSNCCNDWGRICFRRRYGVSYRKQCIIRWLDAGQPWIHHISPFRKDQVRIQYPRAWNGVDRRCTYWEERGCRHRVISFDGSGHTSWPSGSNSVDYHDLGPQTITGQWARNITQISVGRSLHGLSSSYAIHFWQQYLPHDHCSNSMPPTTQPSSA